MTNFDDSLFKKSSFILWLFLALSLFILLSKKGEDSCVIDFIWGCCKGIFCNELNFFKHSFDRGENKSIGITGKHNRSYGKHYTDENCSTDWQDRVYLIVGFCKIKSHKCLIIIGVCNWGAVIIISHICEKRLLLPCIIISRWVLWCIIWNLK